MASENEIRFDVGLDFVIINNKRLDKAELARLGLQVVQGELLPIGFVGDPEKIRPFIMDTIRWIARDYKSVAVQVYEEVTQAVHHGLGIRAPQPGAEVGRMPTVQGMPEAVYSAAVVISLPPFKDQDTGHDPAHMMAQAEHISACATLEDIHREGQSAVQHHLAPLARQGESWIRGIYKMAEPFLPGSRRLQKAVSAMHAWIVAPVQRAQETRQMMGRARAAITSQVEKAAEARGREQGRKEILDRLDDRLRDMITGEEKKK